MEILNDSQWIQGLDSISYTLGQGSYTWAQNVVNRGGMAQTRQGFAEIAAVAQKDPRGIGVITIGGVTWMLAAIGNGIYKLNLNTPTGGLVQLNYPKVHPSDPDVPVLFPIGDRRMVHFELCVQAQYSIKVIHGNDVGYETRNLASPKFVLIIQDGVTLPHYWDGTKCDRINRLYPDTVPNNTPKGSFMKWVGDRLWTVSGRKVRASNLLNPFQNTEELVTASGGFFFLPDTCTGMGVTHDYKSLLAYTNFTTSAFQAGLEDRTVWPNTQDFQRVIFPSIGCVSHRTIINMYGMTWWMAHDGWVGLDNTLSAYQSSRLDVQDHNMSRSKEGINWSTGGGCAGSYDNFLFISVPSANKWNQHTWVMDQAPINTIAGASPPAWAANWTGIRPEQWITCQIRGHQRCFCISRDLTAEGHQSTVWEAFIGQRMDVPKVSGVRKAKDIGCAFEQRFVGLSPSQYMKMRWIELDVAEIVGDVKLQVFYCGRRTSYKKIIDTHLTATVSNAVEEIFNPDDPLPVFVPQYRTVRSYTDVHSTTDNDTEIQTPYLRNKDREFSVLVQWSGQMAVAAIRMAVDPDPDYMEGTEFPDEYLARRITAEGTGSIGCLLPPPNAPNNQLTSKFLSPLKPRWVEFPAYDSAVPNGVFFVAELEANPAPGDYPSNLYPIDVTLTSETQDIDIYYTRDNTHPHAPPNQHGTHYPPRPSMAIGRTLRAIGTRQGMKPSIELHGIYTQSKCADVVLSPPPGGYPPDEFTQPQQYTGPIAAYNFNEGMGTIAHDSTPSSIDGTVHNTTWNPTGKHGKALNFNGTTGYVFLGNSESLILTESMTISAWVYATANPSTGHGTIVAKSNGTTGWELNTNTDNTGQRFCISVCSANNVFAKRYSSIVRSLNTWYHVAGVYNSVAHTLDIYVNGALNNGTLTGVVPDDQVDSISNLLVGRRFGANYWAGIIDDVRIYNRIQTHAEIVADMNVGVAAPPPPTTGFAVTMSCETAGADIRFNLSDVPVTQGQQLYDPLHPPHPYANTIIRAKAFKQYYLSGDEVRGRYFAKPRCATPTLNPVGADYPPEDYNPTKTINVATTTAGAMLRYTINSTDFDADGHNINANHGTVEVHLNDTLRVMAKKADLSDSLISAGTYTSHQVQVETPVIVPGVVEITGLLHEYTVDVNCNTPSSVLYYEIMDGNQNINPTHSSPHINDSHARITVTNIGHRKLRVLAAKAGLVDSAIAEATFDHVPGGGG